MAGAGGFSTRCIHAGEAPDPTTGAHGVPLYQNVTFAFETNGQVEAMRSGDRPHFTYSPRGNPTVRCLELKMANLEGTEASVAMSSGMAAISSVVLTLLADGGHLVASDQLYDLTNDFLREDLVALGGSTTFVDLSDEMRAGKRLRRGRARSTSSHSRTRCCEWLTFACWPASPMRTVSS